MIDRIRHDIQERLEQLHAEVEKLRSALSALDPRERSATSPVLAALSSSEALTAGEVAKATGLGRASVSTTLSKLTKTGEVTKAKRGYRLP